MKIMGKELKPYHKIMVSKDEWHTKKGCGKFMKNALYVQWHGKMHLLG